VPVLGFGTKRLTLADHAWIRKFMSLVPNCALSDGVNSQYEPAGAD
jgi:hypothetical protein